MSAINRIPKGLQEFLGNTAMGKNPAELLQDVRPNIDMFPFWSTDSIRNKVTTGPIGAIGQFVTIQVPQGEAWIPIAVSGDIFGGAGERWRINVHLTDPAGNARTILAVSETVVMAGPEYVSASQVFPQNILVPAGWFFFMQCDSYGGVLRTGSIDLTYVALKT